MTTTTVATRELQDARSVVLLDVHVTTNAWDEHGDLIRHYPKFIDGELMLGMGMRQITIDGEVYYRAHSYGFYLFSVKDDRCLRGDEQGYCGCTPLEYTPVSYKAGEVCEECWLTWGSVRGIGKDDCPHG